MVSVVQRAREATNKDIVIGAYAIVLGIIAAGGAFWLPLSAGDRAVVLLEGLVSTLFAIVMFAKPGAGALVLAELCVRFLLRTSCRHRPVMAATRIYDSWGQQRKAELQ